MHLNRSIFRIVLLLMLAMFSLSQVASQEATDITATLTHDDTERTYTLHLPPDWDGGPLVVALHPLVSSGKAMQALTGLDALAGDSGYAVVYPNSLGLTWDNGRTAAGLSLFGGPRDDVGFINSLVDELIAEYGVNADQVYLTGHGNGGTLAYQLACSTPETFAKVAVVGALMWDYQIENCGADATAVDMLIVAGGQDVFYPADGLDRPSEDGSLRISSVAATLEFWVTRNACDTSVVEVPVDSTVLYTDCADDTSVNVFGVPAAGNNWMRAGDYTLNRVGIDATELVMDYFNGGDALTTAPGIPGPDTPRSYRVYVPTGYDPAEPTPFVFALHGRPSNGNDAALTTGMNAVAEENNFIVVYPDGLDQGWNYVNGSPFFNYEGEDDTLFFERLIDDLAIDLNLDLARGYVAGFSNGGYMTHRLACEGSDLFAAFAAVAGSVYVGLQELCVNVAQPVPILLMHGTEDSVIPWEGIYAPSELGGGTVAVSLSVPEYITFWGLYNRCNLDDGGAYTALPDMETEDEIQTSTQVRVFEDCAGNGEVAVYLIEGGGHTWPGRDLLQGDMGPTSLDFNASEVIWEFFADKQLTTATDDTE